MKSGRSLPSSRSCRASRMPTTRPGPSSRPRRRPLRLRPRPIRAERTAGLMARSTAPNLAPRQAATRAPGRGWYVVAAALAIAGCAGMAWLLLQGLGELGDQLIRLVVPGQTDLRLEAPGTYT